MADLCCTASAVANFTISIRSTLTGYLSIGAICILLCLHFYHFFQNDQQSVSEAAANSITSLASALPLFESEMNSVISKTLLYFL